jgi:hypothetical protein
MEARVDDETDNPIFEIIPRSTAAMQPTLSKPASNSVLQYRLRSKISESTARYSQQEILAHVYAGYKKPGLTALDKQREELNKQLEAEGSTWRVGSTLQLGQVAPGEERTRARKKRGGLSEPSE